MYITKLFERIASTGEHWIPEEFEVKVNRGHKQGKLYQMLYSV